MAKTNLNFLKKSLNPKYLLILILLVSSFLRLYKLTVNPIALFGDEMDVGYQAYSMLKTGRDYSGNFLPLHFQSLAEWRTPLYLYSSVPTVAIWGISPLGVRLPAAIFGILSIYIFYLLVKEITKDEKLSLVGAAIMSINPWHLQYSRAGFEVTLLILLILLGLLFFLKSLKDGKHLWLSVLFLTLTPWVYSTAKLFTPFLMIFLFFTWRKEILSNSKKHLVKSVLIGLLVGLPIALSTIIGGGAQRFNYISVFSDPTTENEIGVSRLVDARVRGEEGIALSPKFMDRLYHNKFTYWAERIVNNYLGSFSTNFLFVKGDPNVRHSIGMGEFYKIDFVILLLGIVFFFTRFKDAKIKYLILFWTIFGVVPSALTRDGGNHATRQIIILPTLIFLMAYGLVEAYKSLSKNYSSIFIALYIGIIFLSFSFYQHEYWTHYPQKSERWWHYGWSQSVKAVKDIDANYDRVFISMSGEPAWIFFAGAYEFSPSKWHEGYPFKDSFVEGFGGMSHIDKFYFGSPDEDGAGLYSLHKYITAKDLYLANAKESGENLILHPDKVPAELNLLKIVAFPSGEPAFYLFSKK